nr:hypothetical protein [Tanacetum cinerariifolium]
MAELTLKEFIEKAQTKSNLSKNDLDIKLSKELLMELKSERKTRKGQNWIKTGQKQEAWRSPKKLKAITELKEDLVTHFQDLQNTLEPSDDSTNVVNAPREPFVVKRDHGSFVDKIIWDLNKAPDSPHLHTFSSNQRHCFHCKDVLGDGESCQRCTCTRCGSGLSKGLCYICGNNQNSLNDSTSISENSSKSPPHVNHHCCYECGDTLDRIFCQRCTCKSCGKGAHIGYNCPPKVPIISNLEPCNQTMNNEPPQTLLSFDLTCYSEKDNSLPYVSKPNLVDESPNVFNPLPQPPIYSCDICGSNSQYGHYCTPQVLFIYPESGYSQDFNFPQNFHDFQQQYLCCDQCGGPYETFQCQQVISYEPCCENCEGSHENFQCQPLNYYKPNPSYDSNYSGFDQFGDFHPQQYPCCEDCGVTHEPYQCQPMNHDYYHEQNSCFDSTSIGFDQPQTHQYTVNHPIFNAHNDYLDSQKKLTITLTNVMEQMTSLTSISNSLEDNVISELPPCVVITPTEPVDSLNMGDEHLDTILATKSDEFIKSSVENLVPNPSESEGENECDVPDGFTTFSNVLFDTVYDFDSSDDQSFSDEDLPKKIYSNPLFHEEIIPMKIDPHSFNAESDLIESMPNHDSSIIISSKIDSLFDEFTGELTLLKSIPSRIDETDCHPEEETYFTKRLLYDNSSPRPLEEFVSENSNADIESFSPSHIPIKDSDSHMEEIDLSFNPDDPMPPGIKEDDDDSERDILILEESLDNYSLSLPEIESFHFDIPSSYRPPAKPPDDNTGILNIKMMGDIFDQKVPIPNLMITRVSSQEKSPDLLPHQGLKAFQSSAECPMMIKGKNTPIMDVPLFHFYPLDQLKYGGN